MPQRRGIEAQASSIIAARSRSGASRAGAALLVGGDQDRRVAGPPGRLDHRHLVPVAQPTASRTCRTEYPVPLPRLITWCSPGAAADSARRWASARSTTWM